MLIEKNNYFRKKRVELINKRLKNIIEALTGSKTLTITGSRDKALVDFNENNTQIASVSQKIILETIFLNLYLNYLQFC